MNWRKKAFGNFLIALIGFSILAPVYATVSIDPFGPYEIQEGDSINGVIGSSSASGLLSNTKEWRINDCILLTGNATNISSWSAIQNCLIQEFGSDGVNQTYSDVFIYSISDGGGDTGSGSTDIILNNKATTGSLVSLPATGDIRTGTIQLNYSITEPAFGDFPMDLRIALYDGSNETNLLTGVSVDTGQANGSLNIDTTLANDDDYLVHFYITPNNESEFLANTSNPNNYQIDNNAPTIDSALSFSTQEGSNLLFTLATGDVSDPVAGLQSIVITVGSFTGLATIGNVFTVPWSSLESASYDNGGQTYSNAIQIVATDNLGHIFTGNANLVINSVSVSNATAGGSSSAPVLRGKDACPNSDTSGSFYDGKCQADDPAKTQLTSSEEDDEDIEKEYEVDETIESDYTGEDQAISARKHFSEICGLDEAELEDVCPKGRNKYLLDAISDYLAKKPSSEQQNKLTQIINALEQISGDRMKTLRLNKSSILMGLNMMSQNGPYALLRDASILEGNLNLATKTGPCPPEEIARLLAMKAKLEAQAAQLSSQLKKIETDLANTTKEKKDLEEEKKKTDKDIQDKKTDCKDKQKELDDINTKIKDLDAEIDEAKKRVQELQKMLANGDSITEHSGDKPLAGDGAGAAVSFDGGATWVVAHGEGGVEDLIDKLKKNQDTLKELRAKEKEIRNQKKKKADLEKQKGDKEKEIKDCEKDLQDLEKKSTNLGKQIQAATKRIADLQAKITELNTLIQQLNDQIKKFNAMAAKCGIKAQQLLQESKTKLDKMPDDLKEKAEEKFDEEATDAEEDIKDDPTGEIAEDDKNTGGGGAAGAAKKLEDAMKAASACPPPEEITRGPFKDETESIVLKGVESIWVQNSRGTRGLTDKSQKEILEQMTKGLKIIDEGDTALGVFQLLVDKNPVSLIYSKGFQGPAVNAILKKLKEWQSKGTLKGLPEWIEYGYGRLREIDMTITNSHTDVYECVDGIRQYSHANFTEELETSECRYSDGGTYEYKPTATDLNLAGCSMGSCPNARPDAFKKGLDKAKKSLGSRVVGSCE